MRRFKQAVVGYERIGLEIHLQPIVTQASGEVKTAFAIRNPQLCDELSGTVLGLYNLLHPLDQEEPLPDPGERRQETLHQARVEKGSAGHD